MTVNELKKFATDVRIETVKCLEARTFGHIGGCLSIADVLTVLYNGELKNIDPADPKKLDRDMLIYCRRHCRKRNEKKKVDQYEPVPTKIKGKKPPKWDDRLFKNR